MIESFFYGACIGGQTLYWFFLKHQTEVLGTRFWEALRLRFDAELLEGEL